MLFESAMDPRLADTAFRVVQNSNTATMTITDGSIAIGSPVVFETNTGSLPTTNYLPQSNAVGQNFVNRPATSTSLVNNLLAGILAKAPGTAAYLDREQIGLAQCYGPYVGAAVKVETTTLVVGKVMIPSSLQLLLGVSGPMTAPASIASTDTAAFTEVPGLGGHFILMNQIASSSATATGTAVVFVRAM